MADLKWSRGYGEILPVENESGDIIGFADTRGRTPEDVISNGQSSLYSGKTVYGYNAGGGSVWVDRPEDIPTWVELNKDTGDIDVYAPDIVVNSELYKTKVEPLLTNLSQAYKSNPDYKMPNPLDSEDEKKDYTVEEIVQKIQDGINLNQMSLGNFYRSRDYVKSQLGSAAADRFDMKRYAILSANGASGKDDDLLSIPKTVSENLRWKNFFTEAESFKDNTITIKDFQDKYYHTDAGRDIFGYDSPDEMKKWVRQHLEAMNKRGAENLSDEEFDEYLRLQAFNSYLSGNEPKKDVINGFVENIFGTAEGIARGTAEFASGLASLADGIWNAVFFLGDAEPGSEAYKRFANPVSHTITGISNIGTNLVLGTTGNQLVGYDNMLTTDHVSDELRALYDSRAQFYIDTNREASVYFMLGYTGSQIAENVAAGKALTGLTLGAASRLLAIHNYDKVMNAALLNDTIVQQMLRADWMTGIGTAAGATTKSTAMAASTFGTLSSMTGREAVNQFITGSTNPTMYQLISGLSKINPNDVVNMSRAMVDIMAEEKNAVGLAAALNQVTPAMVSNLKADTLVWSVGDLVMQTVLDASLQNPTAMRKLIEGSGTDEERNYLFQQAAWNASGYAAGLLLGKMMTAFPKSVAGKAANEAATRKLWQFEGWVSSKRDAIKEAMFGKDWMKNIKNPGKKQVAHYKYVLNKAGEAIAKSGGDVSKTIKSAKVGSDVEAAMRNMRAVEVAFDQIEAGTKVKVQEYMSDAHPLMKSTITNLDNVTKELTTKLTTAGLTSNYELKLGNSDATMGWPREINNYIGNLIEKRILDNKLSMAGIKKMATGEEVKLLTQAKFTDAQKRAYPKLSEYVANAENTLPENITSYIKDTYIPALYKAATAVRAHRMSPKVSLDIEDEILGYISTGQWGVDGSEFAPMIRITEAQKQYADEMAGMTSTTKTGFIKNRSSDPEKIQWGSNADFVNPTLALHRYVTQTAMDEINQTALRAMLNVPTIKSSVLFDGSKTGAARTYSKLEPALDKAIKDGVGEVKTKFDASDIADLVLADYTTKANIQKAETQQKRAEKAIADLEKGNVKVNGAERTRAIQSMPATAVENVLSDEFAKRVAAGGYLNNYNKVATIEDAMTDADTWNKFILDSPIGVRRAIKRAVNGYQQFTGTRFVETGNTMRGRLNALVPGCDVYEWGMLGREHTNGLTSEGLYEFKDGVPEVQAYIMSLDDLRKLTGLNENLEDLNSTSIERIRNLNSNRGVQGVIPVHYNSVEGKMKFYPQARWGKEGDKFPDWETYFNYLQSQGITQVPVAISQLPFEKPADFGTTEYINRSKSTSELLYERQLAIKDLEEKRALREQWEANGWKTDIGADVREQQQSKNGKKLPGTSKLELLDSDIKKAEDLIAQYDKYSIDSSVNNKLGHTPRNITEDIKQMFDEEGYYPFARGQHGVLGEFKMNDELRDAKAVGDAYWITPNLSYAENKEYSSGMEVLKGTIPKEKLLTDKELQKVKNDIFSEKQKLLDEGIAKKITDRHQELYGKVDKILTADAKKDYTVGSDLLRQEADGYLERDEVMREFAEQKLASTDISNGDREVFNKFLAYDDLVKGMDSSQGYANTENIEFLDEDAKKYNELSRYIDDRGNVSSYRAIAEKTGKPVLDTSIDMNSLEGIDSTAYFYYDGIDPDFDYDLGEGLKLQESMYEGWTKCDIDKSMENVYEEYTIKDLMDAAVSRDNSLKKLEDKFMQEPSLDNFKKFREGAKNRSSYINDRLGVAEYGMVDEESALEEVGKYLYEFGDYNPKNESAGNVKNFLEEIGIEAPNKGISEEYKKVWDNDNPFSGLQVYKAGFEPATQAGDDVLRGYFDSSLNDSIESIDNPYLPAPINDTSLNYDAFRLVSEINPDVITDVNRAMLKANKEARHNDIIEKIAKNQKVAKLEFAASVRLSEAKKTLTMPVLNSRMEFINTIDNAIDEVRDAILGDSNAVKVLDAIMVSQDVDEDIAREYATMVFVKGHAKDIKDAAKDVFSYDKFKNAVGKMPGTSIAKMENQMTKEIDRRITERLNDARTAFVTAGGEIIDGDKVLKEIHDLMDDIEKAGHEANVVALRKDGEELLVETDPIVANIANYHVINTASSTEKILSNPVVKGMNRTARFFQTTFSPKSWLKNQPFRDTFGAATKTGAIPIRDGIKFVSKELAVKYDEAIIEDFKKMYPSDFKFIEDNLKPNEKLIDKVLESIVAHGTSTSPALTETAYYKEPIPERGNADEFWGLLDQTKKTLGKVVEKAGKVVEAPNQAREVYLRNLTYMKGLKDGLDAGMSLEDAMNMAKFFRDNGTTNFRHQLYHLRAFAATVNYFGAGINGYTSFWRLFSLDPVGVSTRIFGGLVVPMIVAIGMSLASEENRERYKGLKEYEKEDQFVFVMNGQVIKVPIPQEFSTFFNPIRHAVESLYGANKHAFWELMMTDLLNIGPEKFGDLMMLDRNEFSGDPTILDRMGSLGLSLIDQTMPLVVKTLFSFATGIDTYTGQPIDTSYYSFDENGNRILVGGTQSEFSIALGKATGWSPSVIAWTTKNLFGTVGRDILDTIASGDISKPIKNTLSDLSLTASDYDRTASDWNRMISDLWTQKEKKYLPEYNDYTDQINRENDPEKKEQLKNKRKDAIQPFFNQVQNMVKTLNNKYPGMYDRYRFASVVSLLNFDSGVASGTDAAAQARDLENFYQNRNQAYQWMQDLGISGSDSGSILGHLERDKDGNVVVKINSPLEILSAQSLVYGAEDIHVANIKTILESGTDNYKDQLKNVRDQISAIYDRGNLTSADYDEIDDIKIEWDKKVIAALAPYVEKYSPEAAINNDEVIKYVGDYLYVPDAFKKNNRGYSVTNKSLNYLGNAEDAFKENFIKYAFGVNDHKYDTSWNFSNHKTLGAQ